MGFNELLQLIQQGEPVAPGVPNRPLRTLDQRTRYLWEVLQAAGIGSTVFARDVTVDPAVHVGSPVYFDAAQQRFGPALAAIASDPGTGLLTTAEAAQLWGVVYAKTAADKADLLLTGYAQLDLSAALETGTALRAGSYYLSRSEPGRLTRLKPPVAVPVLKCDGAGMVFVAPQWMDLLSQHTHLHFKLRPLPAGSVTPPAAGEPHVISDPDVDLEGWLPADHASFGGKAPAGAKFGYNLAANPALKNAWPPLPAEDAVLLQDGMELDLGPEGAAWITRDGIWWMSDCYGEAPWPTDLSTTAEELSAWSASSPAGSCYQYQMWMDLYFTRYGFLTEQTVVTSLTSRDARLRVLCAGGTTPARTGALELALDLTFQLGASDDYGPLALKSLSADGQIFRRGPVASGLYAKSNNVTLTGEASVSRTIGGVARTLYYGTVGVEVDNDQDRELPVSLVRLDGALERYDADVMYLGFPAGALTGLRGRLHVPATLNLANPTLRLRFRLLGTAAGTLPALSLSYRRVPASDTVVALPSSDTVLTLSYAATLASADGYLDVQSAAFAVAAGDDVLFSLQRASGDGYAGEVGVLRQTGIVQAN